MSLVRLLPFFMLPFLAACSDTRATFEIKGSAHSLSLIRISSYPWDKTAKYSIVASNMPDCMRRHAMAEAPLDAKVEVYSPGNDAWVIKQGSQMFVTETRTCEGFAKLDKVPDSGMGALMGVFEMRQDVMVFTAAPRVAPPPVPAVEPAVAPAAPATN